MTEQWELDLEKRLIVDELHAFKACGMAGVPEDTLKAAVDLRRQIEFNHAMLDCLHSGEIVGFIDEKGESHFRTKDYEKKWNGGALLNSTRGVNVECN